MAETVSGSGTGVETGRPRARVRRILLIAVLSVVAVAGVAVTALVRTRTGRELALEAVLERIAEQLSAEVTVSAIHSGGLFSEATLSGVAISEVGRPASFSADSIHVRYSIWSLLSGEFALAGMEVWGPRLVVERLPGEDEVNWTRILTDPREPALALNPQAASGEAASTRVVRDVSLYDGEVVVRLPTTASPGSEGVVEAPGGSGFLREQRFSRIRGFLRELALGEAEDVFDVVALSLTGEVWEEPFEVADFRGQVLVREGVLSFDAERLWLPETEMSGSGVVAWADGLEVDAGLSAPVADFEDIRWLVPGLPPATGGLELGLQLRSDTTSIALSSLDLLTEEGGLGGRLTLILSPGRVVLDGELDLRELDVAAFDPWLARPLPWRGALSGSLAMLGEPGDLEISGELETVTTGELPPPSRFEFGGRVHLGADPGVTAFFLSSRPFQFGLLEEIDERVAVAGTGSLRLDAEGRLANGIRLSATVTHEAPGLPGSAVAARGTVVRRDGETFLDVSSDLQPLSFTALGSYYPRLGVTGEVIGSVSAQGPLADLSVDVDVQTPAGPLAANARFDARDIGRSYLARTDVQRFQLSRILPLLPEPTTVTGSAFINGRGLKPDSVEADVRASLVSATVGTVTVDSARSAFRLEAGALTVDTLLLVTSLGTLSASGNLGLADGVPPGEVRVAFTSESLDGLRPFFMSGPLIAADTLSRLEAELLRIEGIDPDTLPRLRDIALDGRVSAEATLRGAVDRFAAQGTASIEGFRFRDHAVAGAEVEYRLDGLPRTEGRLTASIRADSFAVGGRDFVSGLLDVGLSRSDGRLRADLQRSAEESYQARVTFQRDSVGGVINLDELTARFVGGRWNLGGPSRFAWDAERFLVDDFSFTRPGLGGMRIEADGFVARGSGPADFELLVRDLPLERLTHVARLTNLEAENLRGLVSLTLQVSETAGDPIMVGSFEARNLGYGTVQFTRVESELGYRNRRISGEVEAWNEDERVLVAQGALPAALELERVPAILLEDPVNIDVVARAFPAAIVSGVISSVEEVEGLVEGELHLSGTPADVLTDGQLSLREGAVSIPALGVRYTDVEAALQLAGDARGTLAGSFRSEGPVEVGGSLHLRPLRDPTFDLTIEGTGFRAVNRFDIEGVVSGQLRLTESYRSPVVEGALDVEQGTLFLDEFARYQTIVDLGDTTFFGAVDTTLTGVLPVIEASQNLFLDNLTANVDLRVQSDTWLRSRQMDMEIDGDMQLEYDRAARRLVAVGELATIRGSYHSFGKRFVVQEGTVEFIGIPGVNPNLDIQAVARLRSGDDPLNVIANVGGTLVAPSVSLTSDAPVPIEEPELISYLVFGRPAAQLGSGESSVLSGAGQTGFSMGVGALGDQLQRAVVQEIGLVDYFAISNQQVGTLASTQIELGRYLWDDIFVSVDVVPVGSPTQTRTRLPNARLEWRFADQWGFESFAEDPLLRRGVLGVQQSGLTFAHSLGLFVYREWGR